jgi:hypothetical protein
MCRLSVGPGPLIAFSVQCRRRIRVLGEGYLPPQDESAIFQELFQSCLDVGGKFLAWLRIHVVGGVFYVPVGERNLIGDRGKYILGGLDVLAFRASVVVRSVLSGGVLPPLVHLVAWYSL